MTSYYRRWYRIAKVKLRVMFQPLMLLQVDRSAGVVHNILCLIFYTDTLRQFVNIVYRLESR